MGRDTGELLPYRPELSRDSRNASWTDNIEKEKQNAESVQLWSDYHDTLPDRNPNKISHSARGMILKIPIVWA